MQVARFKLNQQSFRFQFVVEKSSHFLSMSLKLIVGPVASGKTSALLHEIRRRPYYRGISSHVLIIRPKMDTRFDKLQTHSGISIEYRPLTELVESSAAASDRRWEGVVCDRLSGLTDKTLAKFGCIIIDEGQFFEDLAPFCKHCAFELGIQVFVAALNATFLQTLFPSVAELIPWCTELVYLSAICTICQQANANISHKISGSLVQIVEIGASEMYRPVCGACYCKLISSAAAASSVASAAASPAADAAAAAAVATTTETVIDSE